MTQITFKRKANPHDLASGYILKTHFSSLSFRFLFVINHVTSFYSVCLIL